MYCMKYSFVKGKEHCCDALHKIRKTIAMVNDNIYYTSRRPLFENKISVLQSNVW